MISRSQLIPTLLTVFAATSAPAVIISGPNGTGLGNATSGSLGNFITNNALPSFPYWDNVIPVSDASGVYLGNGWVMTAAHVTLLTVNVSTITISGTPYTVRNQTQVGTQDVRLYQIGTGLGDPLLPALTSISIDATQPGLTTSFLTFGRGNRQEGTLNSATSSDAALTGSPSNFEWAGAGTMRWGVNNVEPIPVWTGAAPGPYAISGSTSVFTSTFDNPGSGNYLTTVEASHSLGDSGGPTFTLDGGVWVLSGITLAVGSDPALGEPANTTGFGNISVYADLATYKAIINDIVPEPGSAGLCVLAGLTGLRRKRK